MTFDPARFPDHNPDGTWNHERYVQRKNAEWGVMVGEVISVTFIDRPEQIITFTYRDGRSYQIRGDGGWHDMGSGMLLDEVKP